MRIYNRCVNEDEVKQLFESGLQAIAGVSAENRTPEQQALLTEIFSSRDDVPERLRTELSAKQKALSIAEQDDGRRWYVNGQGQTMAIVGDSEKSTNNEVGHRLAISTHETTVTEFRRFRDQHVVDPKISPTNDCPVHNITRYEAAEYTPDPNKS